jgi:hypothetical protein
MRFVIPLDVRIPIALTARVTRNWLSVVVSSLPIDSQSTDISKLEWSIDGIPPLKFDSDPDGETILMVFPSRTVKKLNLDIDPKTGYFFLQRDFIGTDLLDYMRSSSTDFGEYVSEEDNREISEALVGIAVGVSLLMCLFYSDGRNQSEE